MFIARRRQASLVAALVALATADGDFYRDITPHADPARIAADHATRAAESWEDAEDVLPGFVAGDVIADARTVLAALANSLMADAEQDAADARADAIAAGDMDRAGHAIPHPSHRSA